MQKPIESRMKQYLLKKEVLIGAFLDPRYVRAMTKTQMNLAERYILDEIPERAPSD